MICTKFGAGVQSFCVGMSKFQRGQRLYGTIQRGGWHHAFTFRWARKGGIAAIWGGSMAGDWGSFAHCQNVGHYSGAGLG
jgi:hypothetical protein